VAAIDAVRPARRAGALPPDERRSMIVQATLPLLLKNGEMVTTRQIADAAGIAEGTIFRVFADKDELIGAVVEMALDTGALELALAAIDLSLPFEECLRRAVEILQQRVVDIWRLSSSIGTRFQGKTRRPLDDIDALVTLFETNQGRLTVEPIVAARLLRAFTLSMTHPMLAGEPTLPTVIVQFFLYGIYAKDFRC
jgi:AcrR family transcriptional regulator